MSNIKSLLDNQSIRICDHRRCGVHDMNDCTSDIHLHKSPNSGMDFHGQIRIPLKGAPTFELQDDVRKQFRDPHKYKELKKRIEREIEEVFQDNLGKAQKNFFQSIVTVLHDEWQDKLSSEERAKKVTMQIAKAFGLEEKAERIIREHEGTRLMQYTSIYTSDKKRYYLTIQPENIQLGEMSGKYKNKYNI